MRYEVRYVSSGAGGDENHTEGDTGRRPEYHRHRPRQRRKKDELRGNADKNRLRSHEHVPEIGEAHIKRHTEHHKAEDHVQEHQRTRVEVQLNLIDG